MEKYSYFIPGTTPAGGRYEQSTYNNVNGNLTSFRTAAGSVLTNTYGPLNRVTNQKLGDFYNIRYGYLTNSDTTTTSTRLDYKQYTILSQAGTGMSYVYDAAGNITSENNKMTGYTSSYTYDAQNQLSTAKVAGATTYDFTYNYDTYGNLRSKTKNQGGSKQTDTYTYGSNNWLDLLTAYNGKTITYDTIGNPLTYHDGKTFTWEKGRRRLSLNQTSKNLSVGYVYSANGQRMQKTVRQNGTATVHQFYLQEGRLLGEARGNNRLEYIYDAAGNPTMLIYNGTLYYYITNQMGDVVQIRDTSGNTVASYTYDPYGALLSSSGNMAAITPLRYRGYYYDVESGLYYLNSRYYDPATARFINADGYVSTGQGFTGLNMFAYCNNNPVKRTDSAGSRYLECGGPNYDVGNPNKNTSLMNGTKKFTYIYAGPGGTPYSLQPLNKLEQDLKPTKQVQVSVTYTIDEKFIRIDLTGKNSKAIFSAYNSEFFTAVAKDMLASYKYAFGKSMPTRSLGGISWELKVHYDIETYGKIINFDVENTKVADMGTTEEGVDGTAWIFEWTWPWLS